MMNKVITGGILVAVTGGIPGATYLLTQKEKTPTSRSEERSEPSAGEDGQKNTVATETPTPTSGQQTESCTPPNNKGACTIQTAEQSR